MNLYSSLRKIIYPYDFLIKNIPPNSNILDIGCGNSHILSDYKYLKMKSYTGIDPKIKKNIIKKKFRILKFKIQEITHEIKDYNCILMIDVMHHLKKQDQEIIFEEITNNMSNNSIFIYKDISNQNKFFGFMNKMHDLFYNFEKINYLESKKIFSILNKNTKLNYVHYYKRVLWYDHEFIIIKSY